MNAKEFYEKNTDFKSSIVQVYKQEFINLMKEYARIKCEEQKKACFKDAVKDGCYDSILYTETVDL
jgi:hypothetical protein